MPRFSSRIASSRRLTSGSVRETPAGTRSEPESHPPSLLCDNPSRDERKRKRAIRASPCFFLCAFLPPIQFSFFSGAPFASSLTPNKRCRTLYFHVPQRGLLGNSKEKNCHLSFRSPTLQTLQRGSRDTP